jgi:hypothetical protein
MKIIYQCEYCPATSTDTTEMVIHEMNCLFNPANRGCMTCENYWETELEIGVEMVCHKGLGGGCLKTDCDGWEEV